MSTVKPERDDIAAWVIGPYLAVHVLFFLYIWILFWLQAGPKQPVLLSVGLSTIELSPESFATFRQLILAASSAGIGGAVFMIREFYISYAYGKNQEYLKSREIPRYVLLPLSSVILGPIAIFLLQAGAIVFVGTVGDGKIPDYTIVAVSFLFGFSYHDSLRALRKLSQRMFQEPEKKRPTKRSMRKR
jgi:hypothetical protein